MLAELLYPHKEEALGMTRLFAFKLLERVAVTFGLAFAATYASFILGGDITALNGVTALSLGHKALVAGIAAAVQLALSTLLAPHIGDPNSPDIVPGFILKRLAAKSSVNSGTGHSDTSGAINASEVKINISPTP